MTQIEKMTQWLRTFPLWQEEALYVDRTPPQTGNSGLYPTGVEELSRQEDIMGNVTVQNRMQFTLYRVTSDGADNTRQAQWLLALQQWLQSQSAAGLAPAFGDIPHRERIRGEKGKRKTTTQAGTGTYLLTITVDYTKIYKNQGEL